MGKILYIDFQYLNKRYKILTFYVFKYLNTKYLIYQNKNITFILYYHKNCLPTYITRMFIILLYIYHMADKSRA